MRTMAAYLIAIGSAGCVGHSSTVELSSGHRAALSDSLAVFSEQVLTMGRARDVEGTLALYSGRDDFTHVDGGVLVEGPALETGIRNAFGQMTENDIRWVQRPRIMLLNRDAAVIVGRHRFGGGAGMPAHDGMWTGVLQRFDGTWKIVHSHSSDAPAR